jgi:hypothetical protein
MNAATRIRASCRGRLVREDAVVDAVAVAGVAVVVAGVAVVVAGVDVVVAGEAAVCVGEALGMVPIRYVTDRFGFPESRT